MTLKEQAYAIIDSFTEKRLAKTCVTTSDKSSKAERIKR